MSVFAFLPVIFWWRVFIFLNTTHIFLKSVFVVFYEILFKRKYDKIRLKKIYADIRSHLKARLEYRILESQTHNNTELFETEPLENPMVWIKWPPFGSKRNAIGKPNIIQKSKGGLPFGIHNVFGIPAPTVIDLINVNLPISVKPLKIVLPPAIHYPAMKP